MTATAPVVVGLDLSLTSTGVCYDGTAWTITTKQRGPARLETIRDQIFSAPDTSTPGWDLVDLVAIEGYSYGSRNSHAHALGELGGVIRLTLHDLHIPYVEIVPSARAKYATGKGNASKDTVISAISSRTHHQFATSDEIDAWILWAMCLDHYGHPPLTMPASHRVALTKVTWPHLKGHPSDPKHAGPVPVRAGPEEGAR